jgi:hypothetical protein
MSGAIDMVNMGRRMSKVGRLLLHIRPGNARWEARLAGELLDLEASCKALINTNAAKPATRLSLAARRLSNMKQTNWCRP